MLVTEHQYRRHSETRRHQRVEDRLHALRARAQNETADRLESPRRIEQFEENLGRIIQRRTEPDRVGRRMTRAPYRLSARASGDFERALDKLQAEPGGDFRERGRKQQRPSVALDRRLDGLLHGRTWLCRAGAIATPASGAG